MIDNKKTKEIYGYTYDSIPECSKLEIIFICDFCNKEFIKPKVRITRSNKPGKHCCGNMSCRNLKLKENNLLRTGFDNPLKNPKIQEKIKNTIKTKYGVDNISQNKDIITKKQNTYRKKNQGKTIIEWASIKNKSNTTLGQQIKKYGLENALKIEKYKSALEEKFKLFFQEYNIQYVSEYKISNYRADFLINNLIIEANGLYWHSDAIIKDKYYHYNKKLTYEKNGFKSLFFYEDEILNKFEIIKSIILNKLNKSNKINARQCVCNLIPKKEGLEFILKSHLMGIGKGKIYGLYYNKELISCMQIIIKKNHIEISRFCNKLFTNVRGGFSKILQYIQNIYPNHNILTFIDRRYGEGYYLPKLGFIEYKTSLSFQWTKNLERFHRMKYPNNLGYEYKFKKIWDCGQTKYIKYAK